MGAKGGLPRKEFFARSAALERLAELKATAFGGAARGVAATRARMARAVVDPAYFCATYLPHYFRHPLKDFHHEILAELERGGLVGVRIPRDHGKTTLVSFGYVLHQVVCGPVLQAWEEGRLEKLPDGLGAAVLEAWKAADSPRVWWDPYIQIIGATRDAAGEITEALKLDLERNELIAADWGVRVNDPGLNYDDWVVNDVRVRAFGITGSIRGGKHGAHRPRLAIVDDPQDDDTVRSQRRRDAHYRKLQASVKYGLDRQRRRCMVIGTPLHWDAMICRLGDPEQAPGWRMVRYSARRPDGTPLFPERWSHEALLEAEHDEAAQSELFDNPPDDGQRMFPRFLRYEPGILARKKLVRILAVDPSVGKNESSDLQAVVVIGADMEDGRIYVLRCELTRLAPQDFQRHVLEVYAAASPDYAVIETIAAQEFFYALVIGEGARSGLFPGFSRIESQAHSKDFRIRSLAPLIREGLLRTPADGSCRGLERQAEAYPDGKVDGLDALEMAVRQLQTRARGGFASPSHRTRMRTQGGRGAALGRRPRGRISFGEHRHERLGSPVLPPARPRGRAAPPAPGGGAAGARGRAHPLGQRPARPHDQPGRGHHAGPGDGRAPGGDGRPPRRAG